MAGFNFDSIKNGFSKLGDSFKQPADNSYEENYEEEAYEEDYEGGYQEAYEEEEYDDAYSEDGYADEYAEGEYEEDAYDEASYDEESYDEASYDDAYAQEEDGYEEAGYDEGEFDGEYYDSEYEDEPSYDSEEAYDDSSDLGYNPAVFANLNDEDDGYDEENYDDEYQYDEDGVYEDDGEYYDEEGYAENEEEPSPVGAVLSNVLSFILTNDLVMYIALVVLPPLGIWLLWKKNKFDITVRSAISIASLIWMIILLILLFGGKGKEDPTSNEPVNFMQHTIQPTATVQATTPAVQPTDSTVPTATPNSNVANPNGGVTDPVENQQPITYVWATNSDQYYHNAQNCGGMTNASRLTLDSATSRGKTACPLCVGGGTSTSPNGSALPTGTQYYATTRGTWYHVNPSCQGMTGASVVTEANAIADGKTACPECIGYYGTPGGKYYHSVSNCSGMLNAVTNTEAEWIKTGKTACTKCINSGNKVGSTVTDTSTQVYATQGGKYFHTIENCSGMKDASRISIQSAVSAKKTACPRCVSPSKVMVFATANGTYYHTKNNCSGMKDALQVTAEYAIKYNKKACPTCASMLVDSKNTNTSNTTTTTGATGTGSNFENTETTIYVYATSGGTYMHLKSNCSGMAKAQKVTFKQAESAGKKRCPTCMTPDTVQVFATLEGKWFHTISTCQGMKNAVTGTAKKAMSMGKTACPVCAKSLSTTATTSNNNANTGTNNNNNNNNANTGTNNNNNNTTNNNTANNNTNTNFTTDNSNAPTGTASSKVYIKTGKPYYHKGASCSAQSATGLSAVTLEFAIDRGYKACPSCNPPSKITY